MSFWSSEVLRERVPNEHLIEPYDPDRIVHCAYEMGVGGEAFVTSDSSCETRVPEAKKIKIPPGQFGLLITKEVVTIPNDALSFISIRASIKFQGLINVSGFHVDPGYKGQLKFAVYNAGSQDVVLDQDQRVFMIWFANLTDSTTDLYKRRTTGANVITAGDVSRIHGDVASPAELRRQILELRGDLDKKFHSTETLRLINRTILLGIFGLLLASLVTAYLASVRATFGSENSSSSIPAGASEADPSTSPTKSSAGKSSPE